MDLSYIPGREVVKENQRAVPMHPKEEGFFIDDLLVLIHFIIVTIRWTGLARWDFEFLYAP